MAMTPEQFDLYIKKKSEELTSAWKAIPPTENEIMVKAIIDYQFMSTSALYKAIQEINIANQNKMTLILSKLDEMSKQK